ncbi:hypothetical protein BDP55DRAFT_634699 [Colletotrichum godetiae]|uniref:Uncharacterized protein n=1 Tax=Colletotrichum godetiae TaxID=1209918 RepID=A0AAJ0EUX0_9PEZI|nr:uncharacterized protein BDP55DRAFT_634699 [Colletotrichum godetiae]KAK1672685.1 hypothetical protein BDP55DRAFT_634699 [Colletotrichum godetiae]
MEGKASFSEDITHHVYGHQSTMYSEKANRRCTSGVGPCPQPRGHPHPSAPVPANQPRTDRPRNSPAAVFTNPKRTSLSAQHTLSKVPHLDKTSLPRLNYPKLQMTNNAAKNPSSPQTKSSKSGKGINQPQPQSQPPETETETRLNRWQPQRIPFPPLPIPSLEYTSPSY